MVSRIWTYFPTIICVSLLALPALAAGILVKQMPDTKPAEQLSRADLLANKGYYPASCAERAVCTFTGPGGEVWVWEGYARAMLMEGKTLLFRGKCQSACYLAYLEAVRFDAKGAPGRIEVAPGTVFYNHKPYLLRK
jgi:hypothetical protein